MIGIYYPGQDEHRPPGMQIVSGATSVPGASISIVLDSQPPILVTANEAGLWQTAIMGVGIGTHTVRVSGPAGETVSRSFIVGAAAAPLPAPSHTPITSPSRTPTAGMSPAAQVGLVAAAAAAIWWFFIRPGR